MNILILMNIAVIVGGFVICMRQLQMPQGGSPGYTGPVSLFAPKEPLSPETLESDDSITCALEDERSMLAKLSFSDRRTGYMLHAGTLPDEIDSVLEAILGSRPVQPDCDSPVCPKCSATMVKRQKLGVENGGKAFWACSTFPRCGQMEDIATG